MSKACLQQCGLDHLHSKHCKDVATLGYLKCGPAAAAEAGATPPGCHSAALGPDPESSLKLLGSSAQLPANLTSLQNKAQMTDALKPSALQQDGPLVTLVTCNAHPPRTKWDVFDSPEHTVEGEEEWVSAVF